MNLQKYLFFFAVCAVLSGPFSAKCQTAREAAVLLSPEFPDTAVSTYRALWTPAADPSSAVVLGRPHTDRMWLTTDTVTAPQPTWQVPIAVDPADIGVTQSWTINGLTLYATGYVSSRTGLTASEIAAHKRVLIITDSASSVVLSTQLERLRLDLMREGWVVDIQNTFASWGPKEVKRNLILRAYDDTQRGPLTHVIIIGDVPYAMSGGYDVKGAVPNPDYHPEHGGAWAADAYYADVETSTGIDAEYQWTDYSVSLNLPDAPSRAENINIPGDGKFDQSLIPSDLELCVGRIDMRRLYAFGVSETDRTREFELLVKYFDRDHAYRTRAFEPPMRALVEDNFGLFSYLDKGFMYTEAFAASGWRSFAPIVGPQNLMFGDWIGDTPRVRPALDSFPSLLAYGCGGGGYEHCTGLGDISDFVRTPLMATFTLLFGSYFGDVWSDNNIMRGALAADGWVLTCGWAGRPHWFLHSLADGSTIGECQRLSANNGGEYVGATVSEQATGQWMPYLLGNRFVNNLLLGDPTLTLQGPVLTGEIGITENGTSTTLSFAAPAQHDPNNPSQTVTYIIETASSLDDPFVYVGTIPATNDATITSTVVLSSSHKWVRIRPYFAAINRLGPLMGRGLLGHRTITSVAEDSMPGAITLPARMQKWQIFNLFGQTVASFTSDANALYRNIVAANVPSGTYIAVPETGQARMIGFSR